jgi:hypothetical protein
MNSKMGLEDSFLIEGLKAGFDRAFKGFQFVMSPHMNLVAIELAIAFIAILETTDVGLYL